MTKKLWSRDELILALNLYLKLPFGKLHSRTPEIIYLAAIIDRTAGSVAMRLNNFASHIIPWSKNEEERLNPENGICLSPLYDRAFDKGYISITEKYKITISSDLVKKSNKDYFSRYFSHLSGNSILLPKKYLPKKEYLQFHLDSIFRG